MCTQKSKKRNICTNDPESVNMINPSAPNSDHLQSLTFQQKYDELYGRRAKPNGLEPSSNAVLLLEQQLNDIKNAMSRIEMVSFESLRKEKQSKEIRAEWCRLALVLDRFFFIIFLGLIVLSLVVLFPKPGK